ncbi:MAG: ATP synthase F1 subunit delta [Phycisphaerales bacterium]|nr:ATP synthase F1 subunit delta [Phycisphaerales bacterium]
MAGFDHNSTSIADSYAKSLLELTEQARTTDSVVGAFRDFVEYIGRDTAFHDFLTSHAVDTDRRAAVLEKLFRGKLDDLLLSAVQVINRKGRCELIPLIYDRYRLAVEEVRNEVDVYVTSAVPLSDASRTQLTQAVTRVAGKTPRIVEQVDPNILGGLIVRIGDEKLDNSVARQLAAIAGKLDERTVQEIHSGREYVDAPAG